VLGLFFDELAARPTTPIEVLALASPPPDGR
jgi:hypothetical protein